MRALSRLRAAPPNKRINLTRFARRLSVRRWADKSDSKAWISILLGLSGTLRLNAA